MIKQHMMLALVGTALIAGPALAQSTNPPASSTPSASSPSTSSPSASAPAGASGSFISQAQSGQWRASKLVGVDIYGSNNEKIGDVNEVLLDKSGNAQAVVIGVGGFLGVGAKDVAIPFAAVQWKDTPRPSASSSSGTSSSTGTSGAGTTSSSSSANSTKVMDYPDHGMVSMTKDQLQNAPAFKYASDTSTDSGSTSRPAAPAGSTR
jgi:sporulation protein YlmC with PRC-barrel domain